MKKAIIICMILLMPVFVSAEQPTQKYSLNKLFLPNFVYAPCFSVKPDPNTLIWVLDERFFNIVGSTLAPTSCKGGEVCWSWKILTPTESLWDMQIFSSELPLRISNTQKLSESVSQTIKKSISLRKSLSNVTEDAQNFIKNNFESSDAMTKEKSISKSKTTEKTTELNIIPQFHSFLSKALIGHFVGRYPFCISSAVDLFFKAYYSDRVNDLVEAFTLYKTVKPDDIDFSNQNDMLNRAKFLYTIAQADLGNSTLHRQQRNDAAWAQAVLFAKLLDWKEFQEVRQFVDSEIQKAYSKYDKLIKSTTAEIAKTDKNLAAAKYYTDTEILKLKGIDEKTLKEKQNEIRDRYIITSIVTPEQKIIQNFEKALSQNDPILNKKTVKTEGPKIPVTTLAVVVIPIVFVILAVFIRSRRKKIIVLVFTVLTSALLCNSNTFAFTMDDRYHRLHTEGVREDISYMNALVQAIKDDFLRYRYMDPASYRGYLDARFEVYKRNYGDDFQLAVETGTGQISVPGVDNVILTVNFVNWEVVKYTLKFPHGLKITRSFPSPKNWDAMYVRVSDHNETRYIDLFLDTRERKGVIRDLNIPQLEGKILEEISQSKTKAKEYEQYLVSKGIITMAGKEKKSASKSEMQNINIAKNILISKLDEFLEYSYQKNWQRQHVWLNSFVLGFGLEILYDFIQKTMKENKNIKAKMN